MDGLLLYNKLVLIKCTVYKYECRHMLRHVFRKKEVPMKYKKEHIQGVQKTITLLIYHYLFLYCSLNWYVFNID